MKNKNYHQLTQEQRYHISGLRKAGSAIRAIANDVGDTTAPLAENSLLGLKCRGTKNAGYT